MDVKGHKKIKSELASFMDEWLRGVPSKKAVVLIGGPGIGKSTIAHSLKDTYNLNVQEWDGREMNVEHLLESVMTPTLDGRLKLFIIEDADAIKGDTRRKIGQVVRNSIYPLIFIGNDKKKIPGDAKRKNLVLSMWNPEYRTIRNVLQTIVEKEKLKVSQDELDEIAKKCKDFRAAINGLYLFACQKGLVDGKDKELNIFELTQKIIEGEQNDTWFDPGLLELFLSETVMENFNGFTRYDMDCMIGLADRLIGHVEQTNYRPWGWARQILNQVTPPYPIKSRIIVHHAGEGKKRIPYNEEDLKMKRKLRQKIGPRYSEKEWLRWGFRHLKMICEKDLELVRHLKWEHELTDKEATFLYGQSANFELDAPELVEKKAEKKEGVFAYF
jgi:hypothetical protein